MAPLSRSEWMMLFTSQERIIEAMAVIDWLISWFGLVWLGEIKMRSGVGWD